MPLISLYILNHNYGRFLIQAIESVLNQTFQDYEILIIDDGSTDNSIEIIKNYQNIDKIKIILQEKKGLTVNANIAIQEAKGKYLIRLDADDWLVPEALEILYRSIYINPGIAYVFSGYFLTDAKGNITQKINRNKNPFYLKFDDAEPNGACCLIDIEKLKTVNGYNTIQDCKDGLDIFLKFRKFFPILAIPDFLFFYRRHSDNLTNDFEKIKNAIKIIYNSTNNL